jgi:hypothetical protein
LAAFFAGRAATAKARAHTNCGPVRATLLDFKVSCVVS